MGNVIQWRYIRANAEPNRTEYRMSLRRDRIKLLRTNKGLTQEELADLVGVKKLTIHTYEAGKSDPATETLSKLVKALETNSSYLMGEIDYSGPDERLAEILATSTGSTEGRNPVPLQKAWRKTPPRRQNAHKDR